MIFYGIAILITVFITMEGVAWLTHKYIMHGLFWFLHEDHHVPNKDKVLGNQIFERILMMLINEAIDALFLNIASKEDIDLAMTKGVNYPKGLLKWADEYGLEKILKQLEHFHFEYGEDRYRPSVLLRRMVSKGEQFFG